LAKPNINKLMRGKDEEKSERNVCINSSNCLKLRKAGAGQCHANASHRIYINGLQQSDGNKIKHSIPVRSEW
jgi:hypothetical protein